MIVDTDSDNTTLNIYEYSEDVTFGTPSGYTGENLNCDPSNAYITIDQSGMTDYHDALPDDLPCSDVKIVCNVTEECSIKYNDSTTSPLNTYQPFFNCYGPIYIQDLYDINCFGTCPESPTTPPTPAPTSSPTMPSLSPSTAPTVSPSLSPSNAPSQPPTNFPSISPSFSPTYSPSFSPSDSPSVSPSLTPTYSPSLAPSTSPTSSPLAVSEFDSFIDITYILAKITQSVKTRIAQYATNETQFIESVINEKYFIPNVISYDKYLVRMLDIEGTLIEDINTNTAIEWTNLEELKLHAQIECNQDDNSVNYCESIKLQSQSDSTSNVDDFSGNVQKALSQHYDNDNLEFYVSEPQALDILCKDCEIEAPNYVLYSLLSLVILLFIISICALLFNKKMFPKLPGFHVVDDAKWTAVMIFALQFWYVYASPYLCVCCLILNDVMYTTGISTLMLIFR